MTRRAVISLLVALAITAGACATEDAQPPPERSPDTSSTEAAPPTTSSVPVDEYVAAADAFDLAPNDRSLPPGDPESAVGSFGFSRYVYSQQVNGEILPVLIEGPRDGQVRCQAAELACSYLELKEIHDRGEAVPAYLGMTAEELVELVAQLSLTEAAVDEFPTLEQACAAGFRTTSAQNANMGIHVSNPAGSAGFDPARPSIILYARDGGELLDQGEQGQCVDGQWTGEPGYESVGAAFTLPLTDDHPEGFAGPLDNWHVHLNTCVGSSLEGGEFSPLDVDLTAQQRCVEGTGMFMKTVPIWMIHAYVDPDFDAQAGLFSMFNPSIWPLSDVDTLAADAVQSMDGVLTAPINNFSFGDVVAQSGEPVVFTNSDSVPHTVTSQDQLQGAFDTGVFGTGQSAELVIDEPGAYPIYCVLHPGMTGTITVE